MRELCWELNRHMARTGLQSEIRMAQSSSGSRRCLCSHSIPVPPLLDPGGWKTPPQDHPRQGDITILGEGIDQGSVGAPLLNAQVGVSHPPLVPYDAIL